jgi:hypothetical protein
VVVVVVVVVVVGCNIGGIGGSSSSGSSTYVAVEGLTHLVHIESLELKTRVGDSISWPVFFFVIIKCQDTALEYATAVSASIPMLHIADN